MYLFQWHSLWIGHNHTTDGTTDVIQNGSISSRLSNGKQRLEDFVVPTKKERIHQITTTLPGPIDTHLCISGTPLAASSPMAYTALRQTSSSLSDIALTRRG